jgi:hypothetical protein
MKIYEEIERISTKMKIDIDFDCFSENFTYKLKDLLE